MVREIVTVSVGRCGLQMGYTFWNTIYSEHHLDATGKYQSNDDYRRLSKINVFFIETSDTQQFVPRAVLIDLEPNVMDLIQSSPTRFPFKPDNICCGDSSAGNNWAKGHYTNGAEICDEIRDIIRREIEGCEHSQGFQVTHSIGGGTGSGLGSLIILKLRDDYPDKIISTYTVYPSIKVSCVVVEPYNAILSMDKMIDNSDETFVIDNEALFNISTIVLKQKIPTYNDLNFVVSQVMSGITASLRFPGELNSDLRKLGTNLVPFPRLHFFLCSQAPLFEKGCGKMVKLTVLELLDQMWSSSNYLASIEQKHYYSKDLCVAQIYRSNTVDYRTIINGFVRGNIENMMKDIPLDIINLFYEYYKYGMNDEFGRKITTEEVDNAASLICSSLKLSDHFVQWIPNNVKTSIVGVSQNGTEISGTMVANRTTIKDVFYRICSQFASMFKRKAFLHWYKGEGMDEMEFQEADRNVRDLITEYQDKQDIVVNLDDPFGDNEDEYEEDQREETGDDDDDEEDIQNQM